MKPCFSNDYSDYILCNNFQSLNSLNADLKENGESHTHIFYIIPNDPIILNSDLRMNAITFNYSQLILSEFLGIDLFQNPFAALETMYEKIIITEMPVQFYKNGSLLNESDCIIENFDKSTSVSPFIYFKSVSFESIQTTNKICPFSFFNLTRTNSFESRKQNDAQSRLMFIDVESKETRPTYDELIFIDSEIIIDPILINRYMFSNTKSIQFDSIKFIKIDTEVFLSLSKLNKLSFYHMDFTKLMLNGQLLKLLSSINRNATHLTTIPADKYFNVIFFQDIISISDEHLCTYRLFPFDRAIKLTIFLTDTQSKMDCSCSIVWLSVSSLLTKSIDNNSLNSINHGCRLFSLEYIQAYNSCSFESKFRACSASKHRLSPREKILLNVFKNSIEGEKSSSKKLNINVVISLITFFFYLIYSALLK